MKIVFVIMDLDLGGGAEHDIVNLSSGLNAVGHTPVVITSGGRLCPMIESQGIPVITCPVDRRSPTALWHNAQRIAEIAEAHGADVLNPQGLYPAVSCYRASRRLLKRGKIVPNVVTIHMLGRLKWWYYFLGTRILNLHADHVIFESQCELDRVRRHGLRRPFTVIPNCFPAGKIESVQESNADIRRDIGCPEDAVLFVMPARMTPEKNHPFLFDALMRDRVRKLPVHFFLAGDGKLQEDYKTRVEQAGLQKSVTFGGFRSDLPRLYKAADVFLLCSLVESLPLSIREGMAASLPVIATRVGGVPEAVEDGQSGILVPSGNADALADAIVALATDPDLRRSMGRRGHAIYREKFDYDNWIARTLEVMGQVHERFTRAQR